MPADDSQQRVLWDYYRELIRLRTRVGPLAPLTKERMHVERPRRGASIVILRSAGDQQTLIILNFSDRSAAPCVQLDDRVWQKLMESSEERWLGPGAVASPSLAGGETEVRVQPRSAVVYSSSGG